jgi:PAS domain S-box-containing protein
MIYISLIHNISLIVALATVHGLLTRRFKHKTAVFPIISGMLFGWVAVVGMMTPVNLVPGVIFDGRSIILAVAGLFGGPITALVAAGTSAVYRMWLGGGGATMGVCVILESAGIGVLWYYLRRKYPQVVRPIFLLAFGYLVHLLMLGLTITLPATVWRTVLQQISLPVILVYPPALFLVCLIFLELEARRAAENALQQSEAQWRAMFEMASIGLAQTDPATGQFVRVNSKMGAITGYSAEELLRIHVPEITHPEDWQRDQEALQRLLKGETREYHLDKRYVRKDGMVAWVNVNLVVLRDHNGQPTRTFAAINDITQAKQAEEDLRKHRRFLADLIENSGTLIFVKDRHGRYEMVNRKYEQVTGLRREQILGRTDEELFPGPIGQQFRQNDLEVMAAGTMLEKEEVLESAQGKRFFIAIKFPVRGDGDEVRGVCGMTTEITERQRAEAEKEKLQAQLLQAQKMESVGRLAGGVAHDFNNMLQAILGNTALALEQVSPNSPIHDDLLEIQKAAQRSADLTCQLLAFARKQIVSPEILNLNEKVAGLLKMLQRLIGENIQLIWEPEANIWPVKLDASQFDQILTNLTVNARDAIKGVGIITIETSNITLDEGYVRMHPDGQVGDYARLLIRDTGCGMDAETKAHLFEPFFTTKGLGKGTGLGLATVYGVIKQNGGLINVTSEPDNGTTFELFLPRAEAEVVAELVTTKSPPRRGHETILLVEDEAQILQLGRRILEKHGYTVLVALTPGEALKVVRQHMGAIHLLVTDVVMPGLNGRELRERVAELKPGLSCLFISGYTADVIAHQGVIQEGIEFLQKPFTMAALTQKVREVLDRPKNCIPSR